MQSPASSPTTILASCKLPAMLLPALRKLLLLPLLPACCSGTPGSCAAAAAAAGAATVPNGTILLGQPPNCCLLLLLTDGRSALLLLLLLLLLLVTELAAVAAAEAAAAAFGKARALKGRLNTSLADLGFAAAAAAAGLLAVLVLTGAGRNGFPCSPFGRAAWPAGNEEKNELRVVYSHLRPVYITLHYMLHSKEEWEPHSGANERLKGEGDIIKDLIFIV
jgi:hypothetical protein